MRILICHYQFLGGITSAEILITSELCDMKMVTCGLCKLTGSADEAQ